MLERGERLSQFPWPAADAALLASAMRWLMAALILAVLLWLLRARIARKREGANKPKISVKVNDGI
jgi:hypothetical protein